jgi:hypothetical protein
MHPICNDTIPHKIPANLIAKSIRSGHRKIIDPGSPTTVELEGMPSDIPRKVPFDCPQTLSGTKPSPSEPGRNQGLIPSLKKFSPVHVCSHFDKIPHSPVRGVGISG